MRRDRRKKKNDGRRPDSGRRCGTAQTGMPETGASAAMRRTDSSPKPRTQVGRPGDPATRRPGDPATRRPGDPATRRPGDPATRRPGDPATRRPGDHYSRGDISVCQPRFAHRRNGGGERSPSPVHISDHGPVPTVSRRRRPQGCRTPSIARWFFPPSTTAAAAREAIEPRAQGEFIVRPSSKVS